MNKKKMKKFWLIIPASQIEHWLKLDSLNEALDCAKDTTEHGGEVLVMETCAFVKRNQVVLIGEHPWS